MIYENLKQVVGTVWNVKPEVCVLGLGMNKKANMLLCLHL